MDGIVALFINIDKTLLIEMQNKKSLSIRVSLGIHGKSSLELGLLWSPIFTFSMQPCE